MDEEKYYCTLQWFEVVIIFNSLFRNIDSLRGVLASEKLDEDERYALDEELNDYTTLLHKLKARYVQISDRGELSPALTSRLRKL